MATTFLVAPTEQLRFNFEAAPATGEVLGTVAATQNKAGITLAQAPFYQLLAIGYHEAVQRYLISVSETVCFTRHADHREQLTERFLRQSRFLCSFRMRMNTVIAIVSDAYRDVNQLLRERVECAGRHHLFYAFPGPPQRRRMIGQGFPEVVYFIHFPRRHNVVEDTSDFRRGIIVFDQIGR
jgi:hypothetical protein